MSCPVLTRDAVKGIESGGSAAEASESGDSLRRFLEWASSMASNDCEELLGQSCEPSLSEPKHCEEGVFRPGWDMITIPATVVRVCESKNLISRKLGASHEKCA